MKDLTQTQKSDTVVRTEEILALAREASTRWARTLELPGKGPEHEALVEPERELGKVAGQATD